MSTNPRTYAGFVSGMFLFCCLIALSGCGREGFETAGQAATPLAPPNQQDCAPDPSNDGPECEGVTVDNCSEETSRCSTCIYQGAEEFCDGVDNNCNGRVDETLDALCADNLVCSRSAERCLDPTDRCTTDEHCVNQAPAARCEDDQLVTVNTATCNDDFMCAITFNHELCEDGCGLVDNQPACLVPEPDPCEGVTCDTPPAPSCTDDFVVTPAAEGTCAVGDDGAPVCSYDEVQADDACEWGCTDGACNPDPCDGVTCDAAPADVCTDDTRGITRHDFIGQCVVVDRAASCQYASDVELCDQPVGPRCDANGTAVLTDREVGACEDVNGPRCSYEPIVAEQCAFGCAGGVCNPDPCADEVCNTAPADECTDDAMGFTTYEQAGLCVSDDQGATSCEYAANVVACDTPPADECNLDASGITSYEQAGSCAVADGAPVCEYVANEAACDTPPPAFCDVDTVVTPNPAGTCAAGDDGAPTCSYVEERAAEPCPFGCVDGACANQCAQNDECPLDQVCLDDGTCGLPGCGPDPVLNDDGTGGEEEGDCAAHRRADLDGDIYGYGCDVSVGEELGVCRAYEDELGGEEQRPTYERFCRDGVDGDLDGVVDECDRPSTCLDDELITYTGECAGMECNFREASRTVCEFGCALNDADNLRAGASCNVDPNPAVCGVGLPQCPNGELCVDGACQAPVVDTDGDGIADGQDNCPNVANADQTDTDQDGEGDACEPAIIDTDGDGVADADDNCPAVANADQTDTDGDGEGDACEPVPNDRDGDGIVDGDDNCPDIANADQADADGNGTGDACEPQDNVGVFQITMSPEAGIAFLEGFVNAHQGCGNAEITIERGLATVSGVLFPDEGGCRLNLREANGNWLPRCNGDVARGEACNPFVGFTVDGFLCDGVPRDDAQIVANADGTGRDLLICQPPVDTDGDGIADGQDNCPNVANPAQTDADANGVGDVCEIL